jgi:hypothetical protein
MMHLNANDDNNILTPPSQTNHIDQHDMNNEDGSAVEVISEYSHKMYNNNRVNDAGAFPIRSPHALFSKYPNQQDDQFFYPPYFAPVCASIIIDTAAAATKPTPTPTHPNAGIIAYRDLSSNMVADKRKPFVAKGGVRESFPIKLFKMLEHIDLHEPELANIVSWQPDGRSFLIHGGAKKMEQHILPRFFKGQKQYASFRRQLNLWGIRRVDQKGADKGAYYHEIFIRGKPNLCRDMSLLMARTQGSSSSRNRPRYDSTWGNVEEVKPRINTHPALAIAGNYVVPGADEQVRETSNSASSSLGFSRSLTLWLLEEGREKNMAFDQSRAASIFFTLKNQYSGVDLEPFCSRPPRMTQDETHNMLDFLGKISRL